MISDKLRSIRIHRRYKRYHELKTKKTTRMRSKLARIRKKRSNRQLINRVLQASQAIGRARRETGNYIITSPSIADYFNNLWEEKIIGTQSNE